MRRAALTFAIALIAAFSVAPAGIAGSGSNSDPKGDLEFKPADPAAVDIVSTSFGHASKGRLVHKVTVAGTPGNPANGIIPFIYIEMRERSSASAVCDIYVGRYDGGLGVFACGTNERLGSARITRSGHTVRYVFSPRALGNPESYDWAAGVVGPTDNTQGRYDRAPDQDDIFYTHKLR